MPSRCSRPSAPLDLAFDTFVVSLLDGETDTSGYPEYNAIVGGVASHWDEATGDMIVRALVGWGGKGVRGDTDRTATKILSGLLTNVLASQYAVGLDAARAAGAGGRARWTRAAPTAASPRPTSAPSTAPSAACACCAAKAAERTRCPLRLRLHGVRARPRGRATASTSDGPRRCAYCGGRMRQVFSPPAVHFKGSGWAKKERAAAPELAFRRPCGAGRGETGGRRRGEARRRCRCDIARHG